MALRVKQGLLLGKRPCMNTLTSNTTLGHFFYLDAVTLYLAAPSSWKALRELPRKAT